MPEKTQVPSKPKPPPVIAAQLRGDTAELKRLAAAGGRAKALKERLRKAKDKADCEFFTELRQQEILADADRNSLDPNVRVGWDDNFKP